MKELLLKLVRSDRKHLDGALCFLRLFAGFLMLTHGWAKLSSFSTLATTFPDPLGVSSMASLILILFAEIGCSLCIIFGFMTRLVTLPLIFGMLMANFIIHGNDPFTVRELAILYLGIFVTLLWTGAGRYSLDEIIRQKLTHREIPE